MASAYTEDQLVEQPIIGLFAELGWQTVPAIDEVLARAVRSDAKRWARSCWFRDCARR
jgi:hypothetical protein